MGMPIVDVSLPMAGERVNGGSAAGTFTRKARRKMCFPSAGNVEPRSREKHRGLLGAEPSLTALNDNFRPQNLRFWSLMASQL